MKVVVLAGAIVLFFQSALVGQNTTAYVMLRETNTAVKSGIDACTAERKINFVALRNLKINGKDSLMLLPQVSANVSQEVYDKLKKQKIRDVTKLVRQGDVFYSSGALNSLTGAIAVLPEGVPVPKRSTKATKDYYQVVLEGETSTKQKSTFPLSSVAGVYVVPASAPAEDALFAFASDQKDYGTWISLMSRGGSNKVTEVQAGAVESVRSCVEAALAEFKNGRYGAIATATELANTAQKMSPSSQAAKDNINDLSTAKRAVDQVIALGTARFQAKDWDDALDKWGPVQKYQGDENTRELPDFIANYRGALKQSHDQHVDKGNQLIAQHALADALKNFELALSRIPTSTDAARGKREVVTLQVLDQSHQLRTGTPAEPRKALDMLIAVMRQPDYSNEPRLMNEQHGASCDVSEQSYQKGRLAVGIVSSIPAPARPKSAPAKPGAKGTPPRATQAPAAVAPEPSSTYSMKKVSSPKDRDMFVNVREDLVEAVELCSKSEYQDLKAKVDTELYNYHVKQAQSASAQQPPRPATVLAHLNTALSYEPSHQQEFSAMINTARQQLLEKSRAYAGVTFEDISSDRRCGNIAAQLAQFAQGQLASGATQGVKVVGPSDAATLMQRRTTDNAQWIVVNGKVNSCGVTVGFGDNKQENVNSEYWVDEKNNIKQPYQYSRRSHNLASRLDVSYEVVESTTSVRQSGTRLAGQDAFSCEDVYGANDHDTHNFLTRPHNNQCQVPGSDQLMAKPVQQVQNALADPIRDAASKAAVVLYAFAEQATDPALKKERLITFLLTAGPNVPAANTARDELLANDKDLKFEVLR